MVQIIAYPLNALLIISISAGLALYLKRRFQLPWKIWWIGAATFVISQIGHIPFNAFLTLLFKREYLPTPPQAWNPLFNAVVLGLSAGFWEEGCRYAVYRWWAKDARSWRQGIWLGAGHGGMEALLLAGLLLVNFFYLLAMRNTDLSTLVPPSQLSLAQSQVAAYWSAPWYLIFLAFLERLFTLPIQISLSLLVLQVFLRRRIFWLILAFGWHALVDAVAVYVMQRSSALPAEIVVVVACLLSLLMIYWLHTPEPQPAAEPLPTPALSPASDSGRFYDTIETPEQLDRTRYQ